MKRKITKALSSYYAKHLSIRYKLSTSKSQADKQSSVTALRVGGHFPHSFSAFSFPSKWMCKKLDKIWWFQYKHYKKVAIFSTFCPTKFSLPPPFSPTQNFDTCVTTGNHIELYMPLVTDIGVILTSSYWNQLLCIHHVHCLFSGACVSI